MPIYPDAAALASTAPQPRLQALPYDPTRTCFDGAQVALRKDFAAEDRARLTDPQRSGGLLTACAPAALDAVLAGFRCHGFAEAAVVARMPRPAP